MSGLKNQRVDRKGPEFLGGSLKVAGEGRRRGRHFFGSSEAAVFDAAWSIKKG